MHLYSLNLIKPGSINCSIYGNFSGSQAEELVVARGSILELWRLEDRNSGKLRMLVSHDCFGMVRSICPFRLTGTKKDYIIVGSDSGRIVILEYNKITNEFDKIHQETYGKTGVRRVVPGQYIASDPSGRAVMIAAIEKQKFVYILNRTNENQLTISSPLEAHKSHTLVLAITGVDVGVTKNPLFAVIESDYGDEDDVNAPVKTGIVEKRLTYYELELGINHVVRKSTEIIDGTASKITYVPGDESGPGGVIIFCEDKLLYKSYPSGTTLECRYPQRLGNESGMGTLINAVSFIQVKKDGQFQFIYIIQSEYGDLFTLKLNYPNNEVQRVVIQYLDTIAPCQSLNITKKGHLFAASDLGNHGFYRLLNLGSEKKGEIITTSNDDPKSTCPVFFPKELQNLKLLDKWNNLSAIADIKIKDLVGEGNPQIYALCAAGHRSSLRVLRHGIPVIEKAVGDLPGQPKAIWTIKENRDAQHHRYIILSFQTATCVLLFGPNGFGETQDTHFQTSEATLLVHLMKDNSIIQVYPSGVKHIKQSGEIVEWQSKEGEITLATCNDAQLAISVQGRKVIYFEIDEVGSLSEVERVDMKTEVLAMDIPETPKQRQRSKFLVIGYADNTVRLYSLDPGSLLVRLSSLALPTTPESVLLLEYEDPTHTYISDEDADYNEDNLFLHIGLSNGGLFRTSVNKIEGSLTETRTKFLGQKPVKLFRTRVEGRLVLIALSSRPWIGYLNRNQYMMTPLISNELDSLSIDYISGYRSKICEHGFVAFKGKQFKIFKIEGLGDLFSQTESTVLPLNHTPRKMLIHEATQNIIIMESTHRMYGDQITLQKKKALIDKYPNLPKPDPRKFRIIAPSGNWVSGIRIVSPFGLKTKDYKQMGANEAAISMAIVKFDKFKADTFVLVGTVKDFTMVPKSYSQCYVRTLILSEDGNSMDLLHETTIDNMPYSLAPHKGMVLAGVGMKLRMYDLGQKQLLKKCEYKQLYTGINNIITFGERIFMTDISDSFHLLKHKSRENQFVEIADDILPRWVTTACLLDYHTIIGADKFQNVFVCRLPESADEEINEDFYTYKFKWEAGYLNGAACKFEQVNNYFFGEVITSLNKVALTSTSTEVVVAGTSNGSIAVIYPFDTNEELDFFVHLEMYMRMEHKPLAGRDHMAFRSYHGAVKNVIDGNLCEQFVSMRKEKQELLASELDRSPVEVIKKLEDLKNRILQLLKWHP